MVGAEEALAHALPGSGADALEPLGLAQQRAEELRQRGQVVLEEQRAKISTAVAHKETEEAEKPAEKEEKKTSAKKK